MISDAPDARSWLSHYRPLSSLYDVERIEVSGRRGRRRRQLVDDLKGTWGYRELKEEALDRSLWRTGFGRGYGPVAGQTAE